MARKSARQNSSKKQPAGSKRQVKMCQGDMCLNKETKDWYEFQPAGTKLKLIYCSECVEHALRQERQL